MIGAGWGRTGTTSVAAALERLGAGPVCHMTRMFSHPEEARLWASYRRGEPVLDRLDPLYGSGVDWPYCWAWEELAERHPQAPVLLTVRDARSWYASVRGSIHRWADPNAPRPAGQTDAPGPPSQALELVGLVWTSDFGSWDAVLDEEATVAAYEAHVAHVRATCPPERLVEWSVGDGWEPLATALGVPVPDEPFPHLNSRAEGPPRGDDGVPLAPDRTASSDRG